MSPSLHTLDIFFTLQKDREGRDFSPHVVTSLMETLPLMAPNLKTISYAVDIDVNHGYIKAFRHFVQLHTLSIIFFALDEAALWELSTIPTLRDFTCFIDLSNSSALTLPPQGFQSLLSLHAAGSFDDLTSFINAGQLTSLTHLCLPIRKPPIARKPTDLFVAVSRRCNRTVFTSFSAAIDYKFSSESPPPNCLIQHLEPLLAFPNIESFYLSFPRAPPSIHDDDLARFGAAWPQMTAFRVVHNRVNLQPSQYPLIRPTLSGLVDLARRCPRLEAFRVPILDANVIPEETAVLPLGHGLLSIFLHDIVLPATGTLAYTNAATVFNRVFLAIDLEETQKRVWPHGKEWKQFLKVLAGMRKLGSAEGGD
ncbi:hypothetical protein GSI_04824 [Ganoderma sinense ZZ0214-1]|uniref:F-box domain-containing protein n=1 Tax=Ganoderma sinense ZZ0214-1 TaxID=1077348 RepID=A0A2G8SG23_9APHY|nr:hypothetical protein GSI_04824 [Ganoderma sinense ZZ0214-1]